MSVQVNRNTHLSPQAYNLYQKWWDEVVYLKDNSDIHVVYENYLSKYKTLVPKLALLFEVIENFDEENQIIDPIKDISVVSAEKAVRIAKFLESHARYVFDIKTSVDIDNATVIYERFERLTSKFTVRQIAQLNWQGLGRDSEKVKRAIKVLESALVVRKVKNKSRTQFWEVNPYVRDNDMN